MLTPTDEKLEAVQAEAAAAVTDQLRQAETESGLQIAVAIAQGITAAVLQWGEDVTGLTDQQALQHPLNRRD